MALERNDNIWRQLINTLEVPDEGADAPPMESIVKKKAPGKKYLVQKIVTEMYVYTDIDNHMFAEATFQDMFILGEMTEAKLNRILAKRKKENS